jgi:hypothetical protein
MGTSTIDGTVEATELGRSARGLSIYKSIRFRLADGSTRTITKAVAQQPIAAELTPGSSGRFYLFTGFDLKGVHGIRKSDGTAIYEFPSSNAKIFLILGIVNIAWIVLRLSTDGKLPFLAVAFVILAVVGYSLFSKTGREAKEQFAADATFHPQAPSGN